MKNTIKASPIRMHYVDGLRGVAAIMVAWFHLYTAARDMYMPKELQNDYLGHFLNYFAVWGRWGVRLFFVISGVVISYSLQNSHHLKSLASVGRYMIRRSIRLDPTYWVALGISILCGLVIGYSHFNEHLNPVESFKQLITNLFYVYFFFKEKSLISVSWTLTYEIQFYLIFALMIYLSNVFTKMLKTTFEKVSLYFILCVTVFSMFWPMHLGFNSGAWVFPYLHMFFSGVILMQSKKSKIYLVLLIGIYISFLILFFLFRDTSLLALLITHFLFFAGDRVRLIKQFLESRIMLYIGKLSYCIYLLHIPIGLSFLYLIFGNGKIGNHFSHLVFTIFSIAITVLTSTLVYYAIERKTIGWSKKIKF